MDRRVVCVVGALLVAVGACKKKSPDSDRSEPSGAQHPERIITLTPSATELVIAAGALDRLVATDTYSDEPAVVGALPKVGDFLAPNVEAIAKLEPDLVVCDAVQSKAAESLANLDIPILSITMHSIDDIRREIVTVAGAVGAPERGREVLARVDQALERARQRGRERRSRPRVLWVMDRQPDALAEIVAAGPGSFAAELLELVGAVNAVTGSVRYPKLSRESLVKIDADVVIDASAAGDAGDVGFRGWAAEGRSWRAVRAPTDLATPGPTIDESVTRVEALIFGGNL